MLTRGYVKKKYVFSRIFCLLFFIIAFMPLYGVNIFDSRTAQAAPEDLSHRRWLFGNFIAQGGIITVKNGQKATWSEIQGLTDLYLFNKLELNFMAEVQGKGNIRLQVNYNNKKKLVKSILLRSSPYKNYSIKINNIDFKEVGSVGGICFVISSYGRNSVLKLKNISLNLHAPNKNISKVKIKIQDGKKTLELTEILIKKINSFKDFYNKRAAYLLQRLFFTKLGVAVPVKAINSLEKLKSGSIVIGQLAADSSKQLQLTASKLKQGGYSILSKDGKIFITGKGTGAESGVVKLFEKLTGSVFVTNQIIEPPLKVNETFLFPECAVLCNPDFSMRIIRQGIMLGYSDNFIMGNGRCLLPKGMYGSAHHTVGGLLPYSVYGKSYPEYYALQADGKRLSPKSKGLKHLPNVMSGSGVHVCMSNPDVQKIITKNFLAWIGSNLEARYFQLNFGDFYGRHCRCKNCKAMQGSGNITDRNLKFVDAIAREVKKVYPDKCVVTFAYSDTALPPLKVNKISDNIRILYCPYCKYWSNCFSFEANKKGIEILNEWIAKFPNQIQIFDYPSNCGIRIRVWPGFDATVKRLKFYAELKIKGLWFCGLSPEYSLASYPATNSFNAMTRFVCSKILWNSKTDVAKVTEQFLELYYGPAAEYMKEYLELVQNNVKERKLKYHTETRSRSLMTKELAEKCYKIFTKAEHAVAEIPRFLKRVQIEKIHLLYSSITDRSMMAREKSDRIKFLQELAEFTILMRKLNYKNRDKRFSMPKCIKDICGIQIKGKDWRYDPLMEKIVQSPEKALKSVMFRQVVSPENGVWKFDKNNLIGGENWKAYQGRREAKCLRYKFNSQAETNFELAEKKTLVLQFEALATSEQGQSSQLEVKLNDNLIYTSSEQPNTKWHKVEVVLNEDLLKKRINNLKLKCITGPWFMIRGLNITQK